MTIKRRTIFLITVIFTLCLFQAGCSKLNKYNIGIGTKNNDFDYIKQGKVNKIVIENTRDKGFRFEITNESAIMNLYDILSSAKAVSQQSSLQPDYIFDMYEGSVCAYKFNYIASLDSKNSGNFYSDGKNYIVSKRIDDELISRFWNIRRPVEFENVYYESLLTTLDNYRKISDKSLKIGVDLTDDVQVERFILSIDLQKFVAKMNSKGYNAELITNADTKYDIVMNVSTEGFVNSTDGTSDGIYKCTVKFNNNKNGSEKDYYIYDDYKDGNWDIRVFADKAPSDY